MVIFSEDLINLFSNYLTNRYQFVKYNNSFSERYKTPTGVPQGSNLGPLLFLLFINDIETAIEHSDFLLYADDLKIYKKMHSISDSLDLQEDLNSIWKWACYNQLPFSVKKCHTISFSRSLTPAKYSYHLGGYFLERFSSTKDLGVTFEERWKFSQHIAETHSKSLKMLGFILRNARYFRNTLVLRTLYDTLVRSILETSSIIWIPGVMNQCNELKLEKVQRKFLRYLYLKEYGYYPFLFPSAFILGALGYVSLSTRRSVYVIKHFWKLLKGIVDNPSVLEQLQMWAPEGGYSSRSRPLFLPVKSRTGALANSSLAKAIYLLNSVHSNIDIFSCTYGVLVQFVWDNAHLLR